MSALFVMQNATEAVPFCKLLIHRNVTFLKTYRNSTVSTWLLVTWLGTVAKMNCMNYLIFCNLRLQLCISCICQLYFVCLSFCVYLLCGGRIKIVNAFKARLDKVWLQQAVKCDFTADLTDTNKKLSYRRGTARCVVSIKILPIATQQCRNYLYDKS